MKPGTAERAQYEKKIREFIGSEKLASMPLREVIREVIRSELGDLKALDHLIPRNLPERFSTLLFEDHTASAWLLDWPYGKPGTEIHDHALSAGAVVILKGTVKETVYGLTEEGGRNFSLIRNLTPGQVISFPPGYVHRFEDGGHVMGSALSLHFYEPPLIKMNYYRVEVGTGMLIRSGGWLEQPEVWTPYKEKHDAEGAGWIAGEPSPIEDA